MVIIAQAAHQRKQITATTHYLYSLTYRAHGEKGSFVNKEIFNNAIEVLAASLEKQDRLPALHAQLENKFSDRPYQLMAVYQRNRHNGVGGEDWPNKPESAPAVSRYPNILAELDASGWWLDSMARYANVSMGIMVAAMEGNEELS